MAGAASHRTSENAVRHTAVPMTLKLRCTSAARRALRLAPTEDSSAVTQVPMFCPITIGTAAP